MSPRSKEPPPEVLTVADWYQLRDDIQYTIDTIRKMMDNIDKCELKIHLDCKENWKNNILQKIGHELFAACHNDVEMISEMVCLLFPRINKEEELELPNVVI